MTTRRCPYIRLALSCAFALSAVLAHAVTDPRASNYGGGSQLWFQAEDYDERNPDTDEFFVVVDAPDAFGQVATLAVTHVTGRRAGKARHAEAFHEFGHVEPYERRRAIE